MNELIKVEVNQNNEQAVSARELHEKLGIQKRFTDWFYYQAEKLNLVEGQEFITILGETSGQGGRPATDFIVPLDIAKHICMVSGGEKAHSIREYFIQIERAWNSPEQVMARSLQIANKRIEGYMQTIKELAPAAEFGNAIGNCPDAILIRDFAKVLANAGIKIGQDRLFSWLNANGYIYRDRSSGDWRPMQRFVDQGLFRVKETKFSTSSHGERISFTTKVTGKGQKYFYEKLKETA
jgi:anti-repressor protein